MKRSRFSEHQIIEILKAVEAGRTAAASTKSAKRLTTNGSRSTVGCKLQTYKCLPKNIKVVLRHCVTEIKRETVKPN